MYCKEIEQWPEQRAKKPTNAHMCMHTQTHLET